MSVRYYTFTNSRGEKVQLRGDLTMEDLIRMGWTDFGLVKPDAPLPPHVYRHDGQTETRNQKTNEQGT
jgi:hypothetical protein